MSIGTDERFCGEMKNGKTYLDRLACSTKRNSDLANFSKRNVASFIAKRKYKSEGGRREEIYRWWHIGDDATFRIKAEMISRIHLWRTTNRWHSKYGTITKRSKFNFDLWLTAPIHPILFRSLAFRWFWGHGDGRAATLFHERVSLSPFIRPALDLFCVTRICTGISVIGNRQITQALLCRDRSV